MKVYKTNYIIQLVIDRFYNNINKNMCVFKNSYRLFCIWIKKMCFVLVYLIETLNVNYIVTLTILQRYLIKNSSRIFAP